MRCSGCRRLGWLRLPGLKGSHAYSARFYTWLLGANLLLRFSWAHRLLGDLEAHNEVLMAVALLEVLRRAGWLYVRVETELRKLGALLVPLGSRDSSFSGSVGAEALLAHAPHAHVSSNGAGAGDDGGVALPLLGGAGSLRVAKLLSE